MALVRLYPHAPRLGWVIKNLTLVDEGLRFREERGWYEVDDEVAAKLAKLPQQDRHPHGPRAFAVAKDRDEARRLDRQIAEMLRQTRGEDDSTGTPDEPVPAKRPGSREPAEGRSTVAVSDDEDDDSSSERRPTTRRRRRSKS